MFITGAAIANKQTCTREGVRLASLRAAHTIGESVRTASSYQDVGQRR